MNLAKTKNLTAKQAQFVREYMVDFNAAQAAIRAGYSVKSAPFVGYENLNKPYIAAEIDKLKKERADAADLKAEWVINNLIEVAERCMQSEPVRDKEGNPTGEYTFNAAGANKALELLGKYKNLFTDKVVIDGKVSGPPTINVTIAQAAAITKE